MWLARGCWATGRESAGRSKPAAMTLEQGKQAASRLRRRGAPYDGRGRGVPVEELGRARLSRSLVGFSALVEVSHRRQTPTLPRRSLEEMSSLHHR
jgi:hypothetical protein